MCAMQCRSDRVGECSQSVETDLRRKHCSVNVSREAVILIAVLCCVLCRERNLVMRISWIIDVNMFESHHFLQGYLLLTITRFT